MPGNRRGGSAPSAASSTRSSNNKPGAAANSSSSSPSSASRDKPKDDDSSSSGGLVFLHHGQSSGGSGHRSTLTTAARAHASRRGHSKSNANAKKSFRFIHLQSDGTNIPSSHVGNGATSSQHGGPGSAASLLSSRQRSATPIVAPGTSTPLDISSAQTHHFHQEQYQQQLGQNQHQQHQQQNYIIIDSTRAIVAAAGDTNPPRSLSADSWDPFDSLAVHNLSRSEQFMLHYALTTTWAKFGESQSGQQELAQSWTWATIESPAALFAQIAGAASHYLTVPYSDGAAQRKAFTTSLQAKHKALRALQYEIDRFNRLQAQQQLEDAGVSQPSTHYPHHQSQHHGQYPHSQQQPHEHSSPAASTPSSAPSPASTSSVQGSYMTPSQAVQPVSANAAAAAGATDSMVLAILVLAVHDSIDLTPVPEPHPLAPLATYRDLHIYGQMRMRHEHMTALYKIVDQKGGLQKMNQTVFSYVLPPADMLYNLRYGTPPRVASHRQLLPMRDTPGWQPDGRAEFLLSMAGSGFWSLKCPCQIRHTTGAPTAPGMFAPSYSPTVTKFQTVMVGLEEEVLGLLSVMAELTVALDHYIRGEIGAPKSLDFFVNNADLVAHRMMCLGSLLDEDGNIITKDSNDEMRGKHPFGDTTERTHGRTSSKTHEHSQESTGHLTHENYEHLTFNKSTPEASGHGNGHNSGRQGRTKSLPRYITFREISRRAAMVYQDMVIFPTPARMGVKLRHAAAMLPLLRALRPKAGMTAGVSNSYGHGANPPSAMGGGGMMRVQDHIAYDYLLGEDMGRMHLQPPPPPHPQQQHHGGHTSTSDEWWDWQLDDVKVKFDVGGGEVYDEDGMLRLASLSPSSTPSPSQCNTALPGQQNQQHHSPHQQLPKDIGGHGDDGPRPPSIPGEDDFLSWATLIGAIATRFTSLHDAYVEQLAVDIDYRAEQIRHNSHLLQHPMMGGHFTDPAMGPCHYPVQSPESGSGHGYEAHGGQEHAGFRGEEGSAESWRECHARMMHFLWLDSVCNEPGLIVWDEALLWRKWRDGKQ